MVQAIHSNIHAAPVAAKALEPSGQMVCRRSKSPQVWQQPDPSETGQAPEAQMQHAQFEAGTESDVFGVVTARKER